MTDTARSRKMCIKLLIKGHHHHLWTLCEDKRGAEWIIPNSSHPFVNICPRGMKAPIILFAATSFIFLWAISFQPLTDFTFLGVRVLLVPPQGQVC